MGYFMKKALVSKYTHKATLDKKVHERPNVF